MSTGVGTSRQPVLEIDGGRLSTLEDIDGVALELA